MSPEVPYARAEEKPHETASIIATAGRAPADPETCCNRQRRDAAHHLDQSERCAHRELDNVKIRYGPS